MYDAQFSFVTIYKVGKCMMPSVQILKVVKCIPAFYDKYNFGWPSLFWLTND